MQSNARVKFVIVFNKNLETESRTPVFLKRKDRLGEHPCYSSDGTHLILIVSRRAVLYSVARLRSSGLR